MQKLIVNAEDFMENHKKYNIYNVSVKGTCKYCNKEFIMTGRTAKEKRINLDIDINICNRCNHRIGMNDTPKELLKYEIVPFDVYDKYKNTYNSKLKVCFKCKICGVDSISRWNKLSSRKYLKYEPICSNCILKQTTNLQEWKNANSSAQYIAQNRPDVLKKQKEAQEKLMNTDFDKYIEKHSNTKKILRGTYDGISFVGSYELAFINYMYKNHIPIKRADGVKIEYKYNNNIHYYQPDFIIGEDFDTLVEVKGRKNDFVEAKAVAGENYVKRADNKYKKYVLFDDKEFDKHGITRICRVKRLNDLGENAPIVIENFPFSWSNTERCIFPCNFDK